VSVNFLIGSLGMVQGAMLGRTMDFRAIAIIQIAVGTVSGAAGIGMALAGFGVWSLVFPRLLVSPIELFFLWLVAGWHPKIIFDRPALKELLGFGANATAVGILNYWQRNTDNLLVGKFLGTAALGIYSRAYNTMLLPVSQVWGVLGKVMFSALCRLQDDKIRAKDVYVRCLSLIGLVTFPMMMGLFCVADHFVLAVYGTKWAAAVRVLRILSFVGMVQSVGTTVGWVFQSQGRVDWMLRWEILASTITIIGFVIGIHIGTIEAMALSYAVADLFLIYWSFVVSGKLIDMAFREVVESLLGGFWCSVAMAGAVYAVGLLLPLSWPHWMFLVVQVPFGAIFYIAIVHTFDLKAYRELRALLSERAIS
jgi:PST family polysaccharide transporter